MSDEMTPVAEAVETERCDRDTEAMETISSEVSEADELDALRTRVAELQKELEKSQQETSKTVNQIKELYSLFPDANVNALPDTVWQSVSEGNSLAAAYALQLCREKQKADEIRSVNKKNAALSAGLAGDAARGEYFTPSEVRAMSQSEVRANYTKILESMKRWN